MMITVHFIALLYFSLHVTLLTLYVTHLSCSYFPIPNIISQNNVFKSLFRYLYYLQLKSLVIEEVLKCRDDVSFRLAALAIQGLPF